MSEDFNDDRTGMIFTFRCQNWLSHPTCMRFQAGYFDTRNESCDDMIHGVEQLGWQVHFNTGGSSSRVLCPVCVKRASLSVETLPTDGGENIHETIVHDNNT